MDDLEEQCRQSLLAHCKKMPKCELCKGRDWMFSKELMSPITYVDGGVKMDKLYPCVLCICKGCGGTKMINAVVAGLTEGELTC